MNAMIAEFGSVKKRTMDFSGGWAWDSLAYIFIRIFWPW
jgi:hypothetical protein